MLVDTKSIFCVLVEEMSDPLFLAKLILLAKRQAVNYLNFKFDLFYHLEIELLGILLPNLRISRYMLPLII